MVVHLLHKSADGKLAMVAVLLERGSAQPVVQAVWNNLPLEQGDEVAAKSRIDLTELLPSDRRYYTYMGSLTTPPCKEGVLWMVMKTPVAISPEQLAIFARLYPMNARPIRRCAVESSKSRTETCIPSTRQPSTAHDDLSVACDRPAPGGAQALLMIYLLDLTAVIYVSSILISEKYISIDFSRKELAGNAYIAEVRDVLVALPTPLPVAPPKVAATAPAPRLHLERTDWEPRIAALQAAETTHGEGMKSADVSAAFINALQVAMNKPTFDAR